MDLFDWTQEKYIQIYYALATLHELALDYFYLPRAMHSMPFDDLSPNCSEDEMNIKYHCDVHAETATLQFQHWRLTIT